MPSPTQKRREDKVKQEKIIEARIAGANKTEAYMKAFPLASYDTARNEAPQYIARHDLDKRALQRMAEQGMTEGDLFRSLKECVLDDDKRIKLDATKFGLNMIGYGKEDRNQSNASYNPVIINFIVHKKDAQPITPPIDITPI